MIEAIEGGWAIGAYAIPGRGDGAAQRRRWARSGRASVSITHDAVEVLEIGDFAAGADDLDDEEFVPGGDHVTAAEIASAMLRSAARAQLTQARLGPGAVRHLITVNQMNPL